MAEPFLGEIRPFAFNFAPSGWALCDGQVLNIAQNTALYVLIGINYGGNGQTTFNLPDLRGRTPIHPTNGIALGQQGGTETHTLTTNQMPSHTHALRAVEGPAIMDTPSNGVFLASAQSDSYAAPDALTPMHSGSVSSVGAGQSHSNMQPYLVINFCIALEGVFPSRS